MENRLFVLAQEDRPSWVEYPRSYRRLLEQGLTTLTPWHIMKAERVAEHFQGLTKRYPERELFPFAFRQDNDDVACWAKGAGEKVFVIHDFASRGWEDAEQFETVCDWFRSAVDETIAWD